jgi:ABC-type Fe3+-hydroxamate transport system substrate-binding protein
MAFGIGKTELTVLEAKFSMYEDLSKEMLDKLERAVEKISESNQNVALILERHESRLEQADRADKAIMNLIERVEKKLDALEARVDGIAKFRWMTVGIATAAAVVIGSSGFFANLLTDGHGSAIIEEKINVK